MGAKWVLPEEVPEGAEPFMDITCNVRKAGSAIVLNIMGGGHVAVIVLDEDDQGAAEFIQAIPDLVANTLKEATEALKAAD